MSKKLSYKKIQKFNLPERTYKPDWDDTSVEFTLPSGINVSGMTQCNNSPCKMDALEGLDGYIYIETISELEKFIKMNWDETMKYIAENDEDFNPDEY